VSQDNLELRTPTDADTKLRAFFQRFNQTRESQLEALHPEIAWHIRADLPDSRTLCGYEDVERRDTDWRRAFADLQLEPIEVSEASGKTIVVVHFHGRLKGSRDVVDMNEVWVLRWRDDRIIEISEYETKTEALKGVEPAE